MSLQFDRIRYVYVGKDIDANQLPTKPTTTPQSKTTTGLHRRQAHTSCALASSARASCLRSGQSMPGVVSIILLVKKNFRIAAAFRRTSAMTKDAPASCITSATP